MDSVSLGKYLETAKTAFSEKEKALSAITQDELREQNAWQLWALEKIKSELPEVLRPYLQWGEDFEEDGVLLLYLQIPDCTRINVRAVYYKVDNDPAHWDAFIQESVNQAKYEVVCFEAKRDWLEPDGIWKVNEKKSGIYDLQMAVAIAAQAGPHHTEVQAIVDKNNAALAREKEIERRTPLCPLMSPADTVQICLRDRCAWFVTWREKDLCAMIVLAHEAASRLPVEE